MNPQDFPQPSRAARVTVVIKALNEEARIGLAIESALRAVQHLGGEVVLADSCSTDRTVEIASAYPIRIVQLAHPSDRCCGAGLSIPRPSAELHRVGCGEGPRTDPGRRQRRPGTARLYAGRRLLGLPVRVRVR
mgnify:CR=1 FL=1